MRYDGTNWNQFGGTALAYGDPWKNSSVSTMVYDTASGQLYVGGSFCMPVILLLQTLPDGMGRNGMLWEADSIQEYLNLLCFRILFMPVVVLLNRVRIP
ncbi:MAG: hypothetical protein IPN13_14660 [Bacteroidetes bacterium]|nr:hypothetical protein [Bacteroidota bacterium]